MTIEVYGASRSAVAAVERAGGRVVVTGPAPEADDDAETAVAGNAGAAEQGGAETAPGA